MAAGLASAKNAVRDQPRQCRDKVSSSHEQGAENSFVHVPEIGEKQKKLWVFDNQGWHLGENATDWATDATADGSEKDNIPWDGNGHVYGNDAPSFDLAGFQKVVKKMNMREWVRIGIGQPATDGETASDYRLWHVFRAIKQQGNNAVDDADFENEVKTGNVFWGTVPAVAP
jgi:hypothetical protein